METDSFSVIRCPNGCFHNGDCVGATCFCYRGWTGRDCSQYHCNDVHNCSGNGQCVGPNVCKCMPGFLVSVIVLFAKITIDICVIYQACCQDGWILAKFIFAFFWTERSTKRKTNKTKNNNNNNNKKNEAILTE